MIKFLSKFKKKPLESQHTLNPHKHWIVLLWIFFVLVILLILFSFYLLFQIRNEHTIQIKPTIDDKPTLLQEDLLKNVTESFNKKAKTRDDLILTPPTYLDPSL